MAAVRPAAYRGQTRGIPSRRTFGATAVTERRGERSDIPWARHRKGADRNPRTSSPPRTRSPRSWRTRSGRTSPRTNTARRARATGTRRGASARAPPGEREPDARPVNCPSCATELPAEARFCLRCGTSLPVGPLPAEERRVVTVVFCDLVGSTELAGALDPELLRTVLLRYYAVMREHVERHGGVVEKFIGDAVMAVFGLLSTREDDAERAAAAALEMAA